MEIYRRDCKDQPVQVAQLSCSMTGGHGAALADAGLTELFSKKRRLLDEFSSSDDDKSIERCCEGWQGEKFYNIIGASIKEGYRQACDNTYNTLPLSVPLHSSYSNRNNFERLEVSGTIDNIGQCITYKIRSKACCKVLPADAAPHQKLCFECKQLSVTVNQLGGNARNRAENMSKTGVMTAAAIDCGDAGDVRRSRAERCRIEAGQ